MKEIRCAEDLGIARCDLVARGETSAHVVEQIVDHLREAHGMALPAASAILKGAVDEADVDEKVWVIMARLREVLDLEGEVDAGTEEAPPAVSPEPL